MRVFHWSCTVVGQVEDAQGPLHPADALEALFAGAGEGEGSRLAQRFVGWMKVASRQNPSVAKEMAKFVALMKPTFPGGQRESGKGRRSVSLPWVKSKGLAAIRELVMSIEFAEQASDAGELGVALTVDLDSMRSALDEAKALIDEMRDVTSAATAIGEAQA